MAKKQNRRERRARRGNRQPINVTNINTDIPATQLAELAGMRDTSDGEAAFPIDRVDDLNQMNDYSIYEGELEASGDEEAVDDVDSLEFLTEQELRSDETDDAYEASQEGMTYVPPIDPPVIPGGAENAIVASGFGVSALDEPYDEDHHTSFLYNDDELVARVREALIADSSTSPIADQVQISANGGRITLRGIVDDLIDVDNLMAVASYATDVEEVVDALVVRALERGQNR